MDLDQRVLITVHRADDAVGLRPRDHCDERSSGIDESRLDHMVEIGRNDRARYSLRIPADKNSEVAPMFFAECRALPRSIVLVLPVISPKV